MKKVISIVKKRTIKHTCQCRISSSRCCCYRRFGGGLMRQGGLFWWRDAPRWLGRVQMAMVALLVVGRVEVGWGLLKVKVVLVLVRLEPLSLSSGAMVVVLDVHVIYTM